MKKKKVFYHSDFSLLKTGFGRVARLILTHLHNTGKYDIVHFCCGLTDNHPSYKRLPWKCIGALPQDPKAIQEFQRDPKLAQLASYGAQNIDKAMREEKPDVYLAVQDIWGVDYVINKKWFPKNNSAIWTTLDSLPILPAAVKACEKVDNFWVWSNFASKSLNEIGHRHVKTVHGPLDDSLFYRLKDNDRLQIRKRFSIPSSAFVIGYVFRNQLRKSVPNLLEGYKAFKEKNPEVKSFLLLHTHFDEGWGIHKLADEFKIDKNEILCTYTCKSCNEYFVAQYQGQGLQCPSCGEKKALNTTNIHQGATEAQLNEIYNLMDVYCHPFTSGGQEVPIQEAKLTELITLVTNYSCGEEMCEEGAHSLPLDWSEYREHNTEFIKASTKPESIAEKLEQVYKMPLDERLLKGKEARQWVIDNFSIKQVGKMFEEFIDSRPDLDKSIYEVSSQQNPDADINGGLPDKEWVMHLYDKILDMKVDENDQGFKYWMSEIDKGTDRESIVEYFRGVAKKEVSQKKSLEDFLDKDDRGKRILYVIPESAGDVYMGTSIFPSLKEQYPDYNLYVATSPQYFGIVEGNPHVHRVIPYVSDMEDIHKMEGAGSHRGYFEIAFLSHVNAQRVSCYTHNGLDKICFKLKKDAKRKKLKRKRKRKIRV
jgi:glycosyltransferase involved in cell wall biosynthesis